MTTSADAADRYASYMRAVRQEGAALAAFKAMYDFEFDDYSRWRLMEGLDDISLTLRYADEITSFEEHRPHWLPTADAVA